MGSGKYMGFLKALFSQGWVGTLIGIIIGIIGVTISFFLYKASQIGPRLVYQVHALRLIEKERKVLSEEVDICFKGKSVSRLTKTYIVLWNSGKAMINGENIVEDDPLKLEISENAEVLQARTLKVTREANKFTVKINPHSLNEVICNFDYLDPGDGAVIELLHTDEKRYPGVQGTIRGLPRGVLNWGRISPSGSQFHLFSFKNYRTALFFMLFIGVIMLTGGTVEFLYPHQQSLFADPFNRWIGRWFFMIFGPIYTFLSSLALWATRRRFPKSLAIKDIEE